jgi:hypothetical protein
MDCRGKIQKSQFELEALEPRIMLSGNGAETEAVASVPSQQIVHHITDKNEIIENNSADLSSQFAPASFAASFEENSDKDSAKQSQQNETSAADNFLSGESIANEIASFRTTVIGPSDTVSGFYHSGWRCPK